MPREDFINVESVKVQPLSISIEIYSITLQMFASSVYHNGIINVGSDASPIVLAWSLLLFVVHRHGGLVHAGEKHAMRVQDAMGGKGMP